MKILFLLCKNVIDTRNIHVNKYKAEIFLKVVTLKLLVLFYLPLSCVFLNIY